MPEKYKLTLGEFNNMIDELSNQIFETEDAGYEYLYGVPRGGIPIALALSKRTGIPLISTELLTRDKKILVVDDIVDSGRTRERFGAWDFASLFISNSTPIDLKPTYFVQVSPGWINFWWEDNEVAGEDNITRIIQLIGDNPNRNGLKETPERVVKSWNELFYGYDQNPEDVFKTFDDEDSRQFTGLVYLKDIEFYSMCEHHMLPFYGKAMIAYIPNGPVIGASKMARLLDIYARRLQMQERIGEQVTEALMKYLKPKGAACLTEAKHLCIACRGVRKQHSVMGYSSLKGIFLDEEDGIAARNELMSLWVNR